MPPQTLQGSVQFQDLAQDNDFLQAPDVEKVQYLLEDYLPKTDPAFAKAPRQEQLQYINEAVLPKFKPVQPVDIQPAHSGMFDPQQFIQPAADLIGGAAARSVLPFASAAKGFSGDWVDAETPIQNYLRANEQRSYSPEQRERFGVDAPMSQPIKGVAYGIGTVAPFLLGGGLVREAGRRLLPFTSQAAAQGWPAANQMARLAFKGLSRLQSTTLPAQVGTAALEGALYGGLKKLEGLPNEQQFDPMQRITSVAQMAAGGAALPPLAAGAGKVLQAGIRQVDNLLNPEQVYTSISQMKGIQKRAASLYKDLYNLLDRPGLTEAERARVAKSLDNLQGQLRTGKPIRGLARMSEQAKAYTGRATFREKTVRVQSKPEPQVIEAQPLNKAPDAAQTPEPKALQAEAKAEAAPQAEPLPAPTLKGSLKEMAEQSASVTGKTVDELLTTKPKELSPAEADIRANIKAVQDADIIDEANGILRQSEINPGIDYKYDAIKGLVKNEKVGEALESAAKQGKATSLEYVAEIIGRADKNVKITTKGNVKVERTVFTPVSFGKSSRVANPEILPINPKTGNPYGYNADTGRVSVSALKKLKNEEVVKLLESGQVKFDEYPMVRGYDERGHIATYHINESPEGSQILVAKVSEKKPFVGEYANVYLGQRPFLVKDVLGRGVRTENGFMKTSQAMDIMQETLNNLDKVFTLIDDPKTPKAVKQVLTELRDKPKWTNKDLKKLQMWINKKEFKVAVCDILGLSH